MLEFKVDMIEVFECTDCKFAVLFGDSAMICKNNNLPPDAVNEFEPVGKGNAEDCLGFSEGDPEQLPDSSKELEVYSNLHPDIKSWNQVCYEWYLLQNGN